MENVYKKKGNAITVISASYRTAPTQHETTGIHLWIDDAQNHCKEDNNFCCCFGLNNKLMLVHSCAMCMEYFFFSSNWPDRIIIF